MSLLPGARLGPYEIVGLLGQGGMADVFRARDTRLLREVAVKVLPALAAEDPSRLRRFEYEARATGMLNHPNLPVVYDLGTHEGTPYLVTELLEGETLRATLDRGPLPARKAVEYAIQICRGLAAAHEKGIVHRDLKPENLFITGDGRIKILDFGLAKPIPLALPVDTEAETAALLTTPGTVLGTVGYLAPEQVTGRAVDVRTDVFCLGIVLYEMLSGHRAFKRETPVESMMAVLREHPPPLHDSLSPSLALIVRHCLEKDPEHRFQSVRDAAFNLESLLSAGSGASLAVAPLVARRWRVQGRLGVGLALLLAGVLVGHCGWKRAPPPIPTFKQLTFRRGYVSAARFAPDGQTVIYSAAWGGDPLEIFSMRRESPESRSLGLTETGLLAVSPKGELALSLRTREMGSFSRIGTLARVSLEGGRPRDVVEDVEWADWSLDGEQLCVARSVEDASRLEFPIGRVLHQTEGWVTHPRVSPDGKTVAFIEHEDRSGFDGVVMLADGPRSVKVLTKRWNNAWGLAWHRGEIWFTAAEKGIQRALYAVSPSGRQRLVARVPGGFALEDISRKGRALLTHGTMRRSLVALGPGDAEEHDLAWLDWSVLTDLSNDGRQILFHQPGESGDRPRVYLGHTDGSPPVRLGEGFSSGLSRDGKWALAKPTPATTEVTLLPTGPGDLRTVKLGGLVCTMVRWHPDGQRLLLFGARSDEEPRLFVLNLDDARPRLVTESDIEAGRLAVSPDGQLVSVRARQGKIVLYPIGGGSPKPLRGSQPNDWPIQWSQDGRHVYVLQDEGVARRIDRIEVASGRRTVVRRLAPLDPAGILGQGSELITPDGRSYAYSYVRSLSDLFLAGGLVGERSAESDGQNEALTGGLPFP